MKIYRKAEYMKDMNEAQLLLFITEVSFAMDDIALYLDTHPECSKGLACYENYKSMRTQATKDFNSKYGPLNKYSVNDDNYFTWINKPWPWEKGCDLNVDL